MKLIDLFAEMDKKHLKVKDQIKNEYFRVKDLLGRVPSRLELFTYMDDDVYQMAIAHSKDNPFKRYLEFLDELNELSEEEKVLYEGIGREFINLIENTNMSKVYKMPVHFLQESGKGFFVKENGSALALREDLRKSIHSEAFVNQMKDVIEYRAMDYYQRRYREASTSFKNQLCN